MTLMDAQQYDETRDRRRRHLIIIIVIAVMFLAWLAYHFRDYPERHAAAKFFSTLTRQDLEGAYAIWLRDPNWKQHPEKYSNYTFGDFTQDWGPASEWGIIKNYSIDCSLSSGTGVIVQATLNQRAEHAFLYVDKSDRTLHFPPNQIECGNWFGWLTE